MIEKAQAGVKVRFIYDGLGSRMNADFIRELKDGGVEMYPFLPVRWLLRDHYDSVGHLAGYRGPLLVVRAGRDRVIPPASTDRLIASLPDDVLVVNLASSDHNDIDADRRTRTAGSLIGGSRLSR